MPALPSAAGTSSRAAAAGCRRSQAAAVGRTDLSRPNHSAISGPTAGPVNGCSTWTMAAAADDAPASAAGYIAGP
nr:hypothetical protein GCM10020063_063340 [Dactylosporangium thailandense]